ncbi:alpha-N-methyltransferase NTM1 [Chlamydoabsidia padenii]|nr:alpha-N-methyltransferase NTM1 [Chlamydoabsidia padenii]
MPIDLVNDDQVGLMDQPDWYTNAQMYWDKVQPTVDGMLGGFSQVDPVDVSGSLDFIGEFVRSGQLQTGRGCDCGAGIGRVTKHFLLKVPFDTVDLVEQAPGFVEQARTSYLADEIQQGRVGQVICQGLQSFSPAPHTYDLIWCQWVLGHLTDDHLVAFFKRCVQGLKPGGWIGVKENNSSKGYLVDEEDSSATRPNEALKRIFAQAGLTVVKEGIQTGLPAGLFTVRMYMLKPN